MVIQCLLKKVLIIFYKRNVPVTGTFLYLQWFYYGVVMVSLWFYYGVVMVSLWLIYSVAMVMVEIKILICSSRKYKIITMI